MVELRDKLSLEQSQKPADLGSMSGHDGEVIEALMALGYRADESRAALRAIGTEGQSDIKERLGAALKRLGARHTA